METTTDLKTVEKMEVFVKRMYICDRDEINCKPIGCLSAEIHITKNEEKKEVLIEIGFGMSLCNPKDTFSKKRAREISDGRAKMAFIREKYPTKCDPIKTNNWKIERILYFSNFWFIKGNNIDNPDDTISEEKHVFIAYIVDRFIRYELDKICYTPEELAELKKQKESKQWMQNEVQKIREEKVIPQMNTHAIMKTILSKNPNLPNQI